MKQTLTRTQMILDQYKTACADVASAFTDRYFKDKNYYAIGGKCDGVYGIGDYYFNLSDMIKSLELNLTWKCLDGWCENGLDEELTQYNLETWAKLDAYAKKTKFKTNKEPK